MMGYIVPKVLIHKPAIPKFGPNSGYVTPLAVFIGRFPPKTEQNYSRSNVERQAIFVNPFIRQKCPLGANLQPLVFQGRL
jgi:hypothetical protein